MNPYRDAFTCDFCAKPVEGKPADGLTRPCGPPGGHRDFCSHACHVAWCKQDAQVGDKIQVTFCQFNHDCSVFVVGTWDKAADGSPTPLYTCVGCIIAAAVAYPAVPPKPIYPDHKTICEHLLIHLDQGHMVPDRVWRTLGQDAGLEPAGIDLLLEKAANMREESRIRRGAAGELKTVLGAAWIEDGSLPMEGEGIQAVLHLTTGKIVYATSHDEGWSCDTGGIYDPATVIGWVKREEFPLDQLSKDQMISLMKTGEASL